MRFCPVWVLNRNFGFIPRCLQRAEFSIFDMEETNRLLSVAADPNDAGGGLVRRPVGTQVADGFEFDVAGEPIDGWTILFSYSDVDSLTETGRVIRGVPLSASYSGVTKYQFQEGDLAGSFLGLALRHNARASGDGGNTFFWPGSDQLDVFFGYEMEKWSLQLNIFNVLGDDSALSSVNDRLVQYMPDTHFRLTGRFRW